MTKKDFFRIVIKLFGLYSLITTLFYILPSQIAIFVGSVDSIDIFSMIGVFIVVLISVALLAILIYNTDKIISWLDLDKGFDDDKIIFGKLNEENILKLAIVIIGGFLIIDNLAAFLQNGYQALQYDNQGYTGKLIFGIEQKFQWAVNFINLLIGYLLITNYDSLSRKIKQDKPQPENYS